MQQKNFHLCDKFWSVSYNAILSSISLIHIFLKSDLYILTYDITVKYLKINCFLLTAGHALDKLPDVAPLSQEHLATMMKTAFNLGLYSTLEVNHPICDTLTLLNSLSGYWEEELRECCTMSWNVKKNSNFKCVFEWLHDYLKD